MDGFRKAVKAAMSSEGGPYTSGRHGVEADTQIAATPISTMPKVCRSGYHIWYANGKLIYQRGLSEGCSLPHVTDLALRTEPKASAPLVQYDTIPTAKRRYFKRGGSGEALIRKGTVDKCLGEEQISSRGVYVKLARGWILAQYMGRNRVLKV